MNKQKKAFTLVELLVVIATIALLLAVLLPALGAARSQGKAAVCKNNLHQLVLANTGYAIENNGYFVLAAPDIYTTNNIRWHGTRPNNNSPFDWHKSPLISYIANDAVKQCPQRINFKKGDPWDYNYEDGCGGYGYNMMYIGSRLWQKTGTRDCGKPVKNTEIAICGQTLMFADCAMAKKSGDSTYYIEYSFAEPPLGGYEIAWPSIHFRHRSQANIGWADGHISSEKMTKFNTVIDDGINSEDVMLGWFGAIDNSLFDLK
jgi:prepilin-type processing-associated H-X9-DG protein/prepilin-type N-terminal cleavage/methylation domain-containing protein